MTSSKIAVNCILRDGRDPSGFDARMRHTCADHVEISDSPRTSHTQLRRISTPFVIVIEACFRSGLETLMKL